MKESKLFEKIESYIRKQMSEKERITFEQQISTDILLAKKIKQHQEEQKVLELLVEEDLKSKLSEWDKPALTNENKANTSNKKIHLLLLLIFSLSIIGGAFWFYSHNKNDRIDTPVTHPSKIENKNSDQEIAPSQIEEKKNESTPREIPIKEKKQPIATKTQKPKLPKEKNIINEKKVASQDSKLLALAEEHFITFTPTSKVSRSNPSTDKDSLNQALFLFEQGNYQSGNQLLRTLTLNAPENIEIKYFLGAGLYSDKEFSSAIQYLKPILKDPNFLFFEEVEWMLGLSYIFQTEYRQGKAILDNIAKDSDHTYFKQSTEILSNI